MARSSYGIYLMMKRPKSSSDTTLEWKKLIDIKDFPDLGGC